MPTEIPISTRFAHVYGSPGEQPRIRGLMLGLAPILAIVGAGGMVAGRLLPELSRTAAGAMLVVLVIMLAFALRRGRRRLESFLKGARGEEVVARLLGLLPSSYTVFHGLTLATGPRAAGGDLDHVVIGPNGIFLVETKHWSGAITVAGDAVLYDGRQPDRPPLAQVSRAADALRARLRDACGGTVPVQPILCFSGNPTPAAPIGVGGVIICRGEHLLAVIEEHGEPGLAPYQQSRIVAALGTALEA